MNYDTIQLAHGGGGRLSRDLVHDEIVSRFGQGPLKNLPDAAMVPVTTANILFTTDSFVVNPLFFPGGSIGSLAVHGTVNDLAVSGAIPKWLSLGLIIEEGFSMASLREILDSVKTAADHCGVTVATGDTKVVAKGDCDSLFINTSGIGEPLPGFSLGTDRIAVGDCVLITGPMGDHGMAVMACRENVGITNGPVSDSAPVHRLIMALQDCSSGIRFMRDPTRGGTATVLTEAVETRKLDILLKETSIPLSRGTRAAAEMLGLDPMHSACEGRAILFCSPDAAGTILEKWHAMPEGREATRIGHVTAGNGRVIMETITGGHRLVDVPRGELLPRIR